MNSLHGKGGLKNNSSRIHCQIPYFPIVINEPYESYVYGSLGASESGGLIGPPLHLDVSLNTYTDRVNDKDKV